MLIYRAISLRDRLLTSSAFRRMLRSGSAKCLRFGHWLTMCTLNMHVLTYLLTLVSNRTIVSYNTGVLIF